MNEIVCALWLSMLGLVPDTTSYDRTFEYALLREDHLQEIREYIFEFPEQNITYVHKEFNMEPTSINAKISTLKLHEGIVIFHENPNSLLRTIRTNIARNQIPANINYKRADTIVNHVHISGVFIQRIEE